MLEACKNSEKLRFELFTGAKSSREDVLLCLIAHFSWKGSDAYDCRLWYRYQERELFGLLYSRREAQVII